MTTPLIANLLGDYENGRLSRRALIGHLSGLVAAAATLPAAARSAAQTTFAARDVDHIALHVTDVARSAAFYERHLGLTVTRQDERACFLSCGQRDFLALFRDETPGLAHYCFGIDGYTADGAVRKLKAAGLNARREENRVYFDDPDGIEVQVAGAS